MPLNGAKNNKKLFLKMCQQVLDLVKNLEKKKKKTEGGVREWTPAEGETEQVLSLPLKLEDENLELVSIFLLN